MNTKCDDRSIALLTLKASKLEDMKSFEVDEICYDQICVSMVAIYVSTLIDYKGYSTSSCRNINYFPDMRAIRIKEADLSTVYKKNKERRH